MQRTSLMRHEGETKKEFEKRKKKKNKKRVIKLKIILSRCIHVGAPARLNHIFFYIVISLNDLEKKEK